jgi:hypothetical protein
MESQNPRSGNERRMLFISHATPENNAFARWLALQLANEATQEFVRQCRRMTVTTHLAQNDARRGGRAIDARTTRHTSYPVRQKKRKRIEECFGWLKDIALLCN